MTAISASRGPLRTTALERALLWTSVTLDHVVAERIERRSSQDRRLVISAQDRHDDARRDAQARGAMGILP